MMSSNGNIFRVTAYLCGEFTGPGEFPSQRPVTRMFSLISVWINGWVNNRKAGDLRRNRAHYGVIVMDTESKLSLRCQEYAVQINMQWCVLPLSVFAILFTGMKCNVYTCVCACVYVCVCVCAKSYSWAPKTGNHKHISQIPQNIKYSTMHHFVTEMHKCVNP